MAVELDPRMQGVPSTKGACSALRNRTRMIDIAVVDYGMGNLRSVCQGDRARGARCERRRDERSGVSRAAPSASCFPGQGAMPDCMREMDARGLRAAVLEAARSKPFLGICIGLQMLFEHSEEGDMPGLGLLPGRVARFPADAHGRCRGRQAQGAAHGLERGAPDAARTRCGTGIADGHALLFRAQLLSGARASAI